MRPFLAVLLVASTAVTVPSDLRFFGGTLTGRFTVYPVGGSSNYGSLDVNGEGFELTSSNTDSGAVNALLQCAPCRPGDEISLSALFANDDLGEGRARVSGDELTTAFVAGHLPIEAGTVRLPRGRRPSLVLSTTFELADGAELEVYADSDGRVIREPDQVWAQGSVQGRGRATVYLTRARTPNGLGYFVERIEYDFAPVMRAARTDWIAPLIGRTARPTSAVGH
jgi:hypothetical protein